MHEVESGSKRMVGPYEVRATSIFHPAPALAYRIEADGRSIVYATDTEDPFTGQENPVIALAHAAETPKTTLSGTATKFRAKRTRNR